MGFVTQRRTVKILEHNGGYSKYVRVRRPTHTHIRTYDSKLQFNDILRRLQAVTSESIPSESDNTAIRETNPTLYHILE